MPIVVVKHAGWFHKCLHKTHHLLHSQGEGWAHRAYLGMVGIEVKYWYGKAAIAILAIEALCYCLSLIDKE